ncbi:hypothetical protein E4U35_002799 [Claviceps purpurea]|nr:hypothetical protein E4U12_005452 [Claviceps purpurea]KAG6211400.1 hypothetical protein E4U35_002799 [Claviceps purpurea]
MDTSSPDSDTEGLSYQTDSDETHGTEPLQPRLPANMDLLRTRMKKRSILGARLNLHLHARPPRNTPGKPLNSQGDYFQESVRLKKGNFHRLLQRLRANTSLTRIGRRSVHCVGIGLVGEALRVEFGRRSVHCVRVAD